jgi:hypothetical protein
VAFTTASGSGPFTLPFVAPRSGYFTAVVLQQTEGPLQASVTATSTP